MALRVRPGGRILCAALHPEMPGDTYIDDGLHYELTAVRKLIVTEHGDAHMKRGEWWWRNAVPDGIAIDGFYLESPCES